MTGTSHVKLIDHAAHDAHVWVKQLSEMMHWDDAQHSFRLLSTVLHALRDRLPVNEAAHLGAQLPTLIRGVYYDGWHPAHKPVAEYSREAFLFHLVEAFPADILDDPDKGAEMVFALLEQHVSAGEIKDVKSCLPDKIKELWPRAA